MKHLVTSFFLFCTIFMFSCGGDEQVPVPKGITYSNLIAGKKGEWKSWTMHGFRIGKVGEPSESIFEGIDPCMADNRFSFYHNEKQQFGHEEGITRCDESIGGAESGSWYFTTTGLMIIVIPGNQVYDENSALFAYFPGAWKVTKLTSDFLAIEYTDEDDFVYSITFDAVIW